MLFKNYKISIYLFAALLFISACTGRKDEPKPTSGEISLMFESKFGTENLVFGKTYTSAQGEKIEFTQFRYILSNLIFYKEDGSKYVVPNSYYFMGQPAKGKNRQLLTLKNVPTGKYTHIGFSVGVDKATNANTDTYEKGELKAGDGMDWSWKSGYKFINWEGTYANMKAKKNVAFKLHVGADENYKVLKHKFSSAVSFSGHAKGTIHFVVQADQVFKAFSLNALGLNFGNGTFTGVMAGPPAKAKQIADNYAKMFVLHHADVK